MEVIGLSPIRNTKKSKRCLSKERTRKEKEIRIAIALFIVNFLSMKFCYDDAVSRAKCL